MKKLILILILTFSLPYDGQEKETFWAIESIYREDGKPFIGLTGAFMQQLYDYNFNFVKRNDSLYFELPEKFELDLKNFRSLRQLHITDKDFYEMYDHKFSGNSFVIKFKDNATTSPSKNTIIEFKQITKEQFEKNIAEEIAHQKEIAQKIKDFKTELEKHAPITLNPIKKLALKSVEINDDKFENDIKLLIPEEIELRESGDVKNEKFGDIKIGTFKENSKIYDVDHPKNDYGLKQLTIWVSSDPSTFSLEKYVSEDPNIVLVKKEKDHIVGYKISYDFENEKAVIASFFTLKYLKVGSSHIFIHSDVYRSQINNDPNSEEMNKILNFNYLISENINLKK